MTTISQQTLTFNQTLAMIDSQNNPDGILALDTEGTIIDWDYRDGTGYATVISIAAKDSAGTIYSAYLNFRQPPETTQLDINQRQLLKCRLEKFTGWLIIHNAKHDLVALQTLGINYTGKFYCTLQMCHYINENLPYNKSLENCVEHYTKNKSLVKAKDEGFDAIAKIFGWHMVPSEYMEPYARQDAVLHYLLFEAIKRRFDQEITSEYWQYRQDFTRCIINMERRGIRIDVARCEHMTAVGEILMDDVVQELNLNPGSPKDLYELLIVKLGLPVVKRTPKGAISFDKKAMEEYEEILENQDNTTAKLILAYRGWQKAVSSNYRPYVILLSNDGRLRCNYKLHGTRTGRMSSEKPNLQQIPRETEKPWNGEMKQCMIPEDGFTLWDADYAQLEFRLATAYGYEKSLIEIFADPTRDLFAEMAEELSMERYAAKTLTYTIQFGGGAKRISNVFNVSMDRAIKIKNHWFETYPGIAKAVSRASALVNRDGEVALWTKRKRHFFFGTDESHKAFNAIIQGGAADIVGQRMVALWKELDNENECRMLLQVHDSVLFEIKNGTEAKYLPRIKEIMEDVKPNFGVVFRVDLKKWGEK